LQTVYDFIIIGGGPAGISLGVEAKNRNFHNTVILEKTLSHNTTIRDFYKDGKRVDKDWKGSSIELQGSIPFSDGTKETTLDFFQKLIDENSLNILYGSDVESLKKIENHFRVLTTSGKIYHSKKVVISIGNMGKPNKPNYPIPPKTRKIVNFNLDKYQAGEKILVVGGGNSASEYAYDLTKDCDVTLNYRKNNFTRVNPENLNNLDEVVKKGKLKLRLGIDIDHLSQIEERIRVHFNHREFEDFDRIIYAIGGVVPTDFLKQSGVTFNEDKIILNDSLESEVDGLYIAGDLAVSSGGSIALAINHADQIIRSI